MNKTLRIALCGLDEEELKKNEEEIKQSKQEENKTEQKMITMTGPLGEVYTKALAVLFAKKNNVTGEVTMESQANDAIMALVAAKAAVNIYEDLDQGVASLSRQIESNSVITNYDYDINAYVVDPDDFTPEDLMTAVVNYKVSPRTNAEHNYFVIDYNYSNNNNGFKLDNIPLNFDLQAHCDKFGVKLVFGMENFIKVIQPKKACLS